MAKTESETAKGKSQHSSEHHPRPRSRGGVRRWLVRKHEAWHVLFMHRTVVEALLCATVLWRESEGKLNAAFLQMREHVQTERKHRAWAELFGSLDATPDEILGGFVELYGADVVRTEVLGQLAGRTPNDVAASFGKLARVFMNRSPSHRGEAPRLTAKEASQQEYIFDHFPPAEALWYAAVLWRRSDGGVNFAFFGDEMLAHWQRLFGDAASSAKGIIEKFRAMFGDAVLCESFAAHLGGRSFDQFEQMIEQVLLRAAAL